MERRFRENSKWAVMDLDTFKKLDANAIHKTIKKNAEKRSKN